MTRGQSTRALVYDGNDASACPFWYERLTELGRSGLGDNACPGLVVSIATADEMERQRARGKAQTARA